MRTFRLNLIICLLCSLAAIGQTKKHDKTYKAAGDVTVNLDASHTKILVSYWDKNEVKVEAFLKQEQKQEGKREQELLENWKIEVTPQGNELKIVSHAAAAFPGNISLPPLQAPLAKLPEIMMPLQEMIGPLLESISSNPLPPEFYASMGDLHFDYEAYKKDGEKYMKEWEQKVEKNFGKDFEKAMEKWAANFEQDEEKMKKMEAELEKSMEAWGEEFGKEMEKWGEEFGKDMEAWGENFGKQMEAQYGDSKGTIIINPDLPSAGVQRLLKITMPKNGILKLDARHSDVTLSGTTNNLTGRVQHGKFSANTLTGKKTDLKVAYAPVKVKQWNYGVLDASYVEDLAIDRATSIKLKSNSSDVRINELLQTGIFHGSFGELSIKKLNDNFQNVDISLENSDLELDLPEAAYQITYNGTRSEIDYPEELDLKLTESYDNQKLRGFNKNRNSEASITINADFSDVLLK